MAASRWRYDYATGNRCDFLCSPIVRSMLMTETSAGALLREWRVRRRMSQLDLASEAEISQRHLSFMESGRAKPSRDMVLHLADQLDIPLRERNHLLLAAGFAPRYGERKLDDPSLAAARAAVRLVLKGHEPNPAIAHRPALEPCRRQRGNRAVACRRRRSPVASAARQRAEAQPAPAGPGAKDRQPQRMAQPSD